MTDGVKDRKSKVSDEDMENDSGNNNEPMDEELSDESDLMDYMDDEEDDDEDIDDDDDENQTESSEAITRRTYIPNNNNEGEEGELECDLGAYVMFHKAEAGQSCLSFDVLPDNLGSGDVRANTFPQTAYVVAGTQASKIHLNNVMVIKFGKMGRCSKKSGNENEDDEDSEDDSDDEDEESVMRIIKIPHNGCINRIKAKRIGEERTIAATWSELGFVHLWDLEEPLQAIEDEQQIAKYHKQHEKQPQKPIFSFNGHHSEGYALAWSDVEAGTLASGDCRNNIFLWRLSQSGWVVDQLPLSGHTSSVEDLQWSPNEANILVSASVDRTIRVWDVRTRRGPAMTIDAAHDDDVNVVSWNRLDKAFIVSGGDDSALKVWDLRRLTVAGGAGGVRPLATFKHHQKPITSVEWHPTDSTSFAASSDDNQVTLWDLSAEPDEQAAQGGSTPGEDDETLAKLPPQLLFVHQGQKEVKEVHWHPQSPGMLMTTSLDGFDIFRTINF